MTYRGISTEVIKLTGYKNDEIEAYVSKPAGEGPFPGICIIHHMPGWDEWTLELCWKFANRGFAVIAPHLYSRFGPGDPDDVAARARGFNGMSDDQVVGDVDASSRWLRSQSYSNGKVGVIGFCSGGRQTFLVACTLDVDAAVDCYGGRANIELGPNLRCPLLGLFGEDDQSPSPDDVAAMAKVLEDNGKTFDFHNYEGAGHAFFSVDRPSYRVDAAKDGWKQIWNFFGQHLQGA